MYYVTESMIHFLSVTGLSDLILFLESGCTTFIAAPSTVSTAGYHHQVSESKKSAAGGLCCIKRLGVRTSEDLHYPTTILLQYHYLYHRSCYRLNLAHY